MKEAVVEKRLVDKLTGCGFKVLKLTTPGYNGTPDRMILRPTWSPGPPWFIEIKAPGKHARRQQELVHQDWRARGCEVLVTVSTPEEVDKLVIELSEICRVPRRIEAWVPRNVRCPPDCDCTADCKLLTVFKF